MPPQPGWALRPATSAAAETLAEIVREATRAQGRWRVPADEEAEWMAGYVAWSRETADGTDALRVVEIDGRVVGRLRIERDDVALDGIDRPRTIVCGLQLHPDVQGCGVGTAIMSGLQREVAAANGVLDLGVEHDNPDARRLYDRLGFTAVGRDDFEVRMRWVPPRP